MIGVEAAKDRVVGVLAVAVLEDLDRGAAGKIGLNLVGELHRAVAGIVVTFKAPGEADEDVRVGGSWMGNGGIGGGE